MSARSCERMRALRSSLELRDQPHPPRSGDDRDADDRHDRRQHAVPDRRRSSRGRARTPRRPRRGRCRRTIRTRPIRSAGSGGERVARHRPQPVAMGVRGLPPDQRATEAGEHGRDDQAAGRQGRRDDDDGDERGGRAEHVLEALPASGRARRAESAARSSTRRTARRPARRRRVSRTKHTRSGASRTPMCSASPAATPPSTPRSGRRYARRIAGRGSAGPGADRRSAESGSPCHDSDPTARTASGAPPKPVLRVEIRARPDAPGPAPAHC